MNRILLSVFAALIFLLPAVSHGGDPIVTIGGLSDKTAGGPIAFDLAAFEAIDMTEIVTKTPWHKEATTFTGVSGKSLHTYLGIKGTGVDAVALNDYKITIPVSDLLDSGLIFATRINGTPLSVRDKGPIFVIYPFDARPDLNNEVIYGRSIWQLKELRVK